MSSTAVGLAVASGVLIAAANGANDVSKGVATLVGTGLASARSAIAWGAFWIAVGGALGATFSSALVTVFSNGFLAGGVHASMTVTLAAILGAASWVLLATRASVPVSTTHALVGSLVGIALVAYGPRGVQWTALSTKVLVPLLVSPGLAFLMAAAILRSLRSSKAAGVDCVCIEANALTLSGVDAGAPPIAAGVRLTTGEGAACARNAPGAVRLTMGGAHWMTSAGISVARAMNDVPKIVALVLAAATFASPHSLSSPQAFALVTGAMVVGSVVAGRRVTNLLAHELTRMEGAEGFAANAVTATLVAVGATLGLPMSTTHLSAGGILGGAAARRSSGVRRGPLRDMMLAWVVTLPGAALLGAIGYGILGQGLR